MQLNEQERKEITQKLEELKKVEEETTQQLQKVKAYVFYMEELLKDGGEELKQKAKDALGGTNN